MITHNLVRDLKRIGIEAESYKAPPMGDSIFALSIVPRKKTGTILVNQGLAEVEVTGSRKHKQAAVTVIERGRKIVRKCTVYFTSSGNRPPSDEWMQDALRKQFTIPVPAGSKWDIDNIAKVFQPEHRGRYGTVTDRWIVRGTVTAVIGKTTTTHFLMGMDESHNFVAVLPDKPTSVRHARSLLRAPGITADTKRQGEWFFIPCDAKQARRLDALANKNPGDVRPFRLGRMYVIPGKRRGRLGAELEIEGFDSGNGSTHVAKSGIPMGKHLYVRGFITDDRQGHHKTLFLDKWHKVAKNKEGEIKVDDFQRQMMERRRRTWD